MALRNGSINAKYINIAPVRPLDVVIKHTLKKYQYDDLEKKLGFINENRKQRVIDFMIRLFNNNEHDYFFLYREGKFELDEDHCAFLRLSIPIKAESYQIMLESKLLQIKEPFRSKLGYLIGNLYSRVATEDWLPQQCTKERFRQYTQQPIEDSEEVLWIENELHKKLLRNLRQLPIEEQTTGKMEEEIKELKKTKSKKIDEALEIIGSELSEKGINQPIIDSIKVRLINNTIFRGLIR